MLFDQTLRCNDSTPKKYKAAPVPQAVAERLPTFIQQMHQTGQDTLSIKLRDDPSAIDTATVPLLSRRSRNLDLRRVGDAYSILVNEL
jgi:hypothetical protein